MSGEGTVVHRSRDMDTDASAYAQDWFARLRAPDCSAADREAFERWRAADARHADAYANLEDLWNLSAELVRDDPAIAEAAREARRADTRPWLHRRWPLLATAAVLVLTGALLVTYRTAPAVPYATAAGEQRSVTLDDGSVMVLDTATALDVQYDRRTRRLTLRQGRTDFHVRKDPARPFVVSAGAAEVTATGTQFQVRLDGDAGEGTLLQGQGIVATRASAGQTPLAPGERIAVDAAGALGAVQRLSEADRASAEGWTVGQLVVKEWPLAALVAEVNRYGRTPLRLGDAAVGQVPVSGTFDPKAPESLVLALEYGWPVRAERGSDGIVLYAK